MLNRRNTGKCSTVICSDHPDTFSRSTGCNLPGYYAAQSLPDCSFAGSAGICGLVYMVCLQAETTAHGEWRMGDGDFERSGSGGVETL